MKALGSLEGGEWRPYGGWRFNRDEGYFVRTYDYYRDGRIIMTVNRTFHLSNGLTEQRQLNSFDL